MTSGHSLSVTQSRTIALARVLELEEAVRVQDPDVFTTSGKHPQYYIRPWIDTFDQQGQPTKVQKRIYLGRTAEISKRDALKKKAEIMARINRTQVVLHAQVRFGEVLDYYLNEFVHNPEKLSASTREKYLNHIENHIRPAWQDRMLGEFRALEVGKWLTEKGKPRIVERSGKQKLIAGLSWNTRTDLRNILSGIFTKAIEWGVWKGENPVTHVSVGRKKTARPHRKLTIEDTRKLLDALPADVRLICEVALYCTLRISEVLGVQWKHVDLRRGVIQVRQRFYRGDLDAVKSERSQRDVPMGLLAADLATLEHAEEYVFGVRTHLTREKKGRVCRDDRAINQHFLRPAAIALGIYYKGFGFHAFRRGAVTELAKYAGANQAQRMAGHASADISLHYTQADLDAQTNAVLDLQNRVRNAAIKPQQDSSENRVDAKLLKSWWARGDSNARPLPCQG
jgi:integrase